MEDSEERVRKTRRDLLEVQGVDYYGSKRLKYVTASSTSSLLRLPLDESLQFCLGSLCGFPRANHRAKWSDIGIFDSQHARSGVKTVSAMVSVVAAGDDHASRTPLTLNALIVNDCSMLPAHGRGHARCGCRELDFAEPEIRRAYAITVRVPQSAGNVEPTREFRKEKACPGADGLSHVRLGQKRSYQAASSGSHIRQCHHDTSSTWSPKTRQPDQTLLCFPHLAPRHPPSPAHLLYSSSNLHPLRRTYAHLCPPALSILRPTSHCGSI